VSLLVRTHRVHAYLWHISNERSDGRWKSLVLTRDSAASATGCQRGNLERTLHLATNTFFARNALAPVCVDRPVERPF